MASVIATKSCLYLISQVRPFLNELSFQFNEVYVLISIPNNTGFLFFSVYGYVINGCMMLQVNNFVRLSVGSFSNCKTIYALIKFDTFIQRTMKLYQDTCTQWTISKLNNELYEVHQIMTCNVQEVLGVGEKLDYKARDLNQQALIRKWAPVAMLCRC